MHCRKSGISRLSAFQPSVLPSPGDPSKPFAFPSVAASSKNAVQAEHVRQAAALAHTALAVQVAWAHQVLERKRHKQAWNSAEAAGLEDPMPEEPELVAPDSTSFNAMRWAQPRGGSGGLCKGAMDRVHCAVRCRHTPDSVLLAFPTSVVKMSFVARAGLFVVVEAYSRYDALGETPQGSPPEEHSQRGRFPRENQTTNIMYRQAPNTTRKYDK